MWWQQQSGKSYNYSTLQNRLLFYIILYIMKCLLPYWKCVIEWPDLVEILVHNLYLLFICLGAPPSAWEADKSPPWQSSSEDRSWQAKRGTKNKRKQTNKQEIIQKQKENRWKRSEWKKEHVKRNIYICVNGNQAILVKEQRWPGHLQMKKIEKHYYSKVSNYQKKSALVS